MKQLLKKFILLLFIGLISISNFSYECYGMEVEKEWTEKKYRDNSFNITNFNHDNFWIDDKYKPHTHKFKEPKDRQAGHSSRCAIVCKKDNNINVYFLNKIFSSIEGADNERSSCIHSCCVSCKTKNEAKAKDEEKDLPRPHSEIAALQYITNDNFCKEIKDDSILKEIINGNKHSEIYILLRNSYYPPCKTETDEKWKSKLTCDKVIREFKNNNKNGIAGIIVRDIRPPKSY